MSRLFTLVLESPRRSAASSTTRMVACGKVRTREPWAAIARKDCRGGISQTDLGVPNQRESQSSAAWWSGAGGSAS
jgi:hypothetical protein